MGPQKKGKKKGVTTVIKDAAKTKNAEPGLETKKPSALGMYASSASERAGRDWTLSVALPSSIVANTQSWELRSYLVGMIARYLVIYGVDEIILYEDQAELPKSEHMIEDEGEGYGYYWSQSLSFFALNLEYLETPQYLRKILFPISADLKFAGLQNPLDAPHHLRKGEKQVPYREGTVLEEKHVGQNIWPEEKKELGYEKGKDCFVCCGLDRPVFVKDCAPPAGQRVTVFLQGNEDENGVEKKIVTGRICAPSEPRTELGVYWGYQVRSARSLSHVFTEGPNAVTEDKKVETADALFSNMLKNSGYDLVLGTSERGVCLDKMLQERYGNPGAGVSNPALRGQGQTILKQKKNVLVLFGGLGGLEDAMRNEQFLGNLSDVNRALVEYEGDSGKKSVRGNPRKLCHHYVNTCMNQNSRTIRCEEAILITLAKLQRFLQ